MTPRGSAFAITCNANVNAAVEFRDGFTTTVLPDINPGASFFIIVIETGKFQGTIATKTPLGFLWISTKLLSLSNTCGAK